jgi:hypothetical protein
MALDLVGYEARARDAVRAFWAGRRRGAAGDGLGGFYVELRRNSALPGYFCSKLCTSSATRPRTEIRLSTVQS